MSLTEIPVEFTSDEKGYYDRQCPNEKCEYVFKIYMEDWKEKVSDEQVFCPMCGHTAPSEQWYTHEQIEAIQEIAASYAQSTSAMNWIRYLGKWRVVCVAINMFK